MLKRKLVIATAVLAAAAFAGGAYAATQGSATNTRRAFLNDAASRLHVTPAQLNNALTGAFEDQLNAAVKAGKLTQAQANAIAQRIKDRGGVPFLVAPWLLAPPGAGLLPRAFGFVHPRAGGLLSVAASYLGLTRPKLLSQLRAGKSLAQVAKARGKSTSGLEQALVAAEKARLDKAVANKRITSAQEQQLLTRLRAKVGALVNATPWTFRPRQIPLPGIFGPGAGPAPVPGGPGPRKGPGPGEGPGGGGPPWGGPWPHPGNYVPVPAP